MIIKKILLIGVVIVLSIGGYFVHQKFYQVSISIEPNAPTERLLDEIKNDNNIFVDEDEQINNDSTNEPGNSKNDNRVRRAPVKEEVEPVMKKLDEIIYNEETGNYEHTIFESVGDYEIIKRESYDFIEIETSEYEYDDSVVGSAGLILPTKRFEIDLPGGALIDDVEIVAKNPIALGQLDIPVSTNAPEMPGVKQYTDAPDSIGLFDEMYSYFTYKAPDEVDLRIDLFPITYDTVTDEATLFKDVEIKVIYKTDKGVVLLSAGPNKQHYYSDEIIKTTVQVKNIVNKNTSVEVEVSLKDRLNKIVSSQNQIIELRAMETKEVQTELIAPLKSESYWIETKVTENQKEIGISDEHINVEVGEVTNFEVRNFKRGKEAEFEIAFENKSKTEIDAAFGLSFYDGSSEVGDFFPIVYRVKPGEKEMHVFTWEIPDNFFCTKYMMVPKVVVEGLPVSSNMSGYYKMDCNLN